jgi:hypothetical protein
MHDGLLACRIGRFSTTADFNQVQPSLFYLGAKSKNPDRPSPAALQTLHRNSLDPRHLPFLGINSPCIDRLTWRQCIPSSPTRPIHRSVPVPRESPPIAILGGNHKQKKTLPKCGLITSNHQHVFNPPRCMALHRVLETGLHFKDSPFQFHHRTL